MNTGYPRILHHKNIRTILKIYLCDDEYIQITCSTYPGNIAFNYTKIQGYDKEREKAADLSFEEINQENAEKLLRENKLTDPQINAVLPFCNDSPLHGMKCEECNEPFQPKTAKAKYCSTRCRVKAHRRSDQYDFTKHRHPALAVPCLTCKAKEGVWCVRPSEHKAQALHKERLLLADKKFIQKHGSKASIEKAGDQWHIDPTGYRTLANPQNQQL